MIISEPLTRYAQTRDAEAFAQIVREYQSFVLITCRRKLRNPADVDDAVQETFLRLARHARHLRSNLGAWLHRCAVNVSIDINRRRRTRFVHESAAASPDARSDDPRRELAELREHLDDALGKLSDEDRELIIERFFVGTSQVDIAANAGVASSTVSQRIDRAIESLRQHLGAIGCAATATTAGALGELLHAEHASAAVDKSLTANLMKIGLSGVEGAASISLITLSVVAILLLGLGLGSWWIWDHFASANPPVAMLPQQPAAATTAPSAFTVNSDQPGNAAIPPVWQQTQTAAQTGVLAGRVTDESGHPVSGAVVEINGTNQRTRTNAQGNYNFASLRGGKGTYDISVTADGFVSLDPFPTQQPTIQISPASKARRDFVLQRGAKVDVLLTDAQGKAMAGVAIDTVRLGEESRGAMLMRDSDRNGRVKYTLPLNQGDWVILASMDNYAPTHQVIRPASGDATMQVKLIMQPGLKVRGVAICSDHKPAAGWKISAQPDWWTGSSILSPVKIDQNGNFLLTSVGPGQYALQIMTEDSGRQIGNVQLPPTTQPILVNVPLASPGSLVTATGRIRLVGGSLPTNQLWVEFASLGDREFYSVVARSRPHSRNEMEYSIKLPPGAYRLAIDSPYTPPKTIERVELPGELPLITLRVTGKPLLTGMVTDPSGNPLTNFAVRVRKFETLGDGPNYAQDAQWTQVNDRAGRFGVECVGPGVYSVQISSRDYAWLWSPKIQLEENQAGHDLHLRVTSGGSVSGIVTDSSGKPVMGAKVIPLSMAVSTDIGMEDHFDGEAGAVTTDSTGRFVLPHLQAGNETLRIVDPDFALLDVSNVTVVEGKKSDLGSISLHDGGAVEGTVYDANGKPFAGAKLLFQDSHEVPNGFDTRDKAHQILSVTTDDHGHYRAKHLPTQWIWINLANGWNLKGVMRRVVRPIDGRTAQVDFGGSAAIKGRIVADGHAYAYQPVELVTQSIGGSPVQAMCASDSDGYFTFFGPPPGHYALYCMSGSRGDWIPLRELDATDQPQDLGTFDCDQGDVVLRFTFDDPAVASSRRSVCVSNPWQNGLLWARMLDFGEDGDHMRAKNVPAQKLSISAAFFAEGGSLFTVPFERKARSAETTVTMHIPKSSATLRMIDTGPGAGKEPQNILFDVRTDDEAVRAQLGLDKSGETQTLLPPGHYRMCYTLSSLRIPGFAPFDLKAGETTEVRADYSRAIVRFVNVAIWSADGVLVTSPQPEVFGADNVRIAPTEMRDVGTRYMLRPGEYRVLLQCPGRPAFTQKITVPALSSPERPWMLVPIDVVLPE